MHGAPPARPITVPAGRYQVHAAASTTPTGTPAPGGPRSDDPGPPGAVLVRFPGMQAAQLNAAHTSTKT